MDKSSIVTHDFFYYLHVHVISSFIKIKHHLVILRGRANAQNGVLFSSR